MNKSLFTKQSQKNEKTFKFLIKTFVDQKKR